MSVNFAELMCFVEAKNPVNPVKQLFIRDNRFDRPIRIVRQFGHFHIPEVRFAGELHIVVE